MELIETIGKPELCDRCEGRGEIITLESKERCTQCEGTGITIKVEVKTITSISYKKYKDLG